MKLPCYLVRDLLPLYKDEVCDPQTAADLKEHLAGCESCRAALAALAAEPAARAVEAEKQRADAVALRLLRRRLVVRWIAIALAAAVLTLALLLGYRGGAGGQIRDIPADAIEEVVLREDGSLHAWLKGGLAYTTMSGVRAEVGGREAVFFTVGVSVWDSQVRALENLRNGLLKDRWYGASDLTILQGARDIEEVYCYPISRSEELDTLLRENSQSLSAAPDYASLLWTNGAT